MRTRDRTELTTYTREDLELLAMWTAKSTVVGPGMSPIDRIGEQRARWVSRGALEVTTDYSVTVE